MFEKIMNLIQSRTRDEWAILARDSWVSSRIWAQENGELAFVFGVAFGFCVLVLYKLFFLVLALGFIVAFVVYHLAPVDREELAEFETEIGETARTRDISSSRAHDSSAHLNRADEDGDDESEEDANGGEQSQDDTRP